MIFIIHGFWTIIFILFVSDVLSWTPTHGRAKQVDQHEYTFSNYVRIRDVVQKTCQRQWTIGKSSERGSGISVLPARHDDDDDNDDDDCNIHNISADMDTSAEMLRI